MKIHKRFPRSLTSAQPAAPASPAPSRVRSNSASCIATAPGVSVATAPSGARSLYTAASSPSFGFFDSPPSVNVAPPPPTSARPGSSSSNLIVSTRLAAEVKAELEPHQPQPQQTNNSSATHQHGNSSSGSSGGGPPPYSLVFSSTNNQPDVSNFSGHHLQAHYQLLFPNHGHLPFGASNPHPDGSVSPANEGILTKAGNKRQRLRYHLDVGAYGIPKHSRKTGAVAGRDGFAVGGIPHGAGMGVGADRMESSTNDDNLAVQVGEDAYFIRENAMGVADGVGGWAKARAARGKPQNALDDPSPSALFAHRLMHYCCEEVEAAIGARASSHSSLSPELDRQAEEGVYSLDGLSSATDLHDQLDDSLEDLADGLDVLRILEKAYEKTIRAHVVVPDAQASPMQDPSVYSPSSAGGDAATLPDRGTRSASGESSASGASDMASSRSSDAHIGSTQSTNQSPSFLTDPNTQPPRSNAYEQSHEPSAGIGARSASSSSTVNGYTSCTPDASSACSSSPRASIPLMEGSSTALLAVLEHTPLPSPSSPPLSLAHSRPRSPSPLSADNDPFALGSLLPRTPVPAPGKGRGTGLALLNPQARRLLERGTPAYPVPPVVHRGREAAHQHSVDAKEEEAVKDDRQGGAVLRIAHLGDCMAMLVRGEDIVWRTEEMWWNFNTPVQLGPSSSTRPADAKTFSIPVQEDDILILASDGLSDNLWDEDILDEVVRFRRSFITPARPQKEGDEFGGRGILGRGTLAGMLSEALCSRARCVSERRPQMYSRRRGGAARVNADGSVGAEDDIPFGRRAREEGRWFAGGKLDDISVLVAVVSPIE